MRDIAYSLSAITVKRGERVRFVFVNKGQLQHDAFVGTKKEQADHENQMRKSSGDGGMSGMHHGGSSDASVTVLPGKSDSIELAFTDKGEQIIGCHEPGHYAGGMRIAVTVE